MCFFFALARLAGARASLSLSLSGRARVSTLIYTPDFLGLASRDRHSFCSSGVYLWADGGLSIWILLGYFIGWEMVFIGVFMARLSLDTIRPDGQSTDLIAFQFFRIVLGIHVNRIPINRDSVQSRRYIAVQSVIPSSEQWVAIYCPDSNESCGDPFFFLFRFLTRLILRTIEVHFASADRNERA